MAGHSAWKNIKHKKAAIDAKRGKAWSKCARLIIVAAKHGGGDPDSNLSRYAIEEARFCNMPKDTIEKAVKKGTGSLGGENYESVMYEGYGPGGVAMIELLTDNRNRTAPEIKRIFERHGGNLGTTGCVAYQFQSKGQVTIPKSADEDAVMAVALDAGADDVSDQGGSWQVVCELPQLVKVRAAIDKAGLPVEAAGPTMVPASTVTVAGKDARRMLALVEELEDHDDVQKVHANFEVPDEELAALGNG